MLMYFSGQAQTSVIMGVPLYAPPSHALGFVIGFACTLEYRYAWEASVSPDTVALKIP